MKKVLLGTTAIVAATAAASAVTTSEAKADITLSGWFMQSFGVGIDQDDNNANTNGLVSYQNSEIHFRANTTLDNGMEVAWVAELEANSGASGMDEARVELSDTWGSVMLGSQDSVSDVFHAGTAWVGWQGADSGTWTLYTGDASGAYFGATGSAFLATSNTMLGDPASIHYYTPSFSGFQAGIGYAPDGSSGTGSTAGIENVISGAISYSGEFESVSVGASVGADHALSTNAQPLTGTNPATDDMTIYRAALDLGFGGFGLNLGYAQSDGQLNATTSSDAYTFAVLASYSTGPHTIGVGWATGEAEMTVANPSETEGDIIDIGYNYNVGAGVDWDAHVGFVDVTGETAGNGDDTDAAYVQSGVAFYF